MPDIHFDTNAWCVDHTAMNRPDMISGSNLCVLPDDFVTEARALGAPVETRSGIAVVSSFLYNDPAMLLNIPEIDSHGTIKNILEKIRRVQNRLIVLTVSGPYSVLMSLVEPSLFYRWLKKYPVEVHTALDRITMGLSSYMGKALESGAKVISLADPYSNDSIIGGSLYRDFTGDYLIKLLRAVSAKSSRGVIHLCPHASFALERYGYITSERLPVEDKSGSYIDTLAALSDQASLILTGHRCIYSGPVSGIHLLRF